MLEWKGGLGTFHVFRRFMAQLAAHVRLASGARRRTKAEHLRDEMREYLRLKEIGVLSAGEYETAKVRILEQHSPAAPPLCVCQTHTPACCTVPGVLALQVELSEFRGPTSAPLHYVAYGKSRCHAQVFAPINDLRNQELRDAPRAVGPREFGSHPLWAAERSAGAVGNYT